MLKSVKSRAEEQFAATQKKGKKALKEKDKARRQPLLLQEIGSTP